MDVGDSKLKLQRNPFGYFTVNKEKNDLLLFVDDYERQVLSINETEDELLIKFKNG